MAMSKEVKQDLLDASDSLEDLLKRLPNLSLATKIDIAARLKGCATTLEKIDKAAKEAIKLALDNKTGMSQGYLFNACLNITKVTRLDQTSLKEEKPKLYAQYCVEREEGRITFTPR